VLERNGFANSTAAKDTKSFAGIDAKADIIEHNDIAERLANMLEGNVGVLAVVCAVFDDGLDFGGSQWVLPTSTDNMRFFNLIRC